MTESKSRLVEKSESQTGGFLTSLNVRSGLVTLTQHSYQTLMKPTKSSYSLIQEGSGNQKLLNSILKDSFLHDSSHRLKWLTCTLGDKIEIAHGWVNELGRMPKSDRS